MHRLLLKQLQKHLAHSLDNDEMMQTDAFRKFLNAVDRAYQHYDQDRSLLERTIEINSRELNDVNNLLKKQNEEISILATRDTLTHLPNRLVCHDRITQALNRAHRNGKKCSILFIDLDRFKFINDTLGHHIGDLLLKNVAKRLVRCTRDTDTVARLGGDEFTILLDDVQSSEDALILANKILKEMARPFWVERHELIVTASIGISCYPEDGDDMVTLVKNADTAMYRAKDIGRNTVQLYRPSMSAKGLENMALESALRRALPRHELFLHFQPQIDLATGRIIGTEALVRWYNPEIGIVHPSSFIPLAEETGLILGIGDWILHQACLQNSEWLRAGLQPVRVAVNISARQMMDANFLDSIDHALNAAGLPPHYLELELTESTVMKNPEITVHLLQEIKRRGIFLSIDDFGTGYSSLANLKRFPIDTLKIDRDFVRDIATDPDDAAIVTAIIAMAHSLKQKVIAEGVETAAQLEFLQKQGCDQIQGFFVSKPLKPREMAQLLRHKGSFLANDTARASADLVAHPTD